MTEREHWNRVDEEERQCQIREDEIPPETEEDFRKEVETARYFAELEALSECGTLLI